MQLRVRMSARSLLEVLPQLVWSQWVFCQGNENKKSSQWSKHRFTTLLPYTFSTELQT